MGYRGKVAILVGSAGAPCHEDRAKGARDVISKYGDMEIVAIRYDMDSVDLAHDLAVQILKDCPDLDGIICCNMSNPVGAARAVTEMNRGVVIVGMDHDEEALRYLDEGVMAFMPTHAMNSRKKVARKRRNTDFRKDFMQVSSVVFKTVNHHPG